MQGPRSGVGKRPTCDARHPAVGEAMLRIRISYAREILYSDEGPGTGLPGKQLSRPSDTRSNRSDDTKRQPDQNN